MALTLEHLRMVVALALIVGLTVAALALLLLPGRRGRGFTLRRRRVLCPVHDREATVVFRVDQYDVPHEVVSCDLRPSTEGAVCAGVCRSVSVTPAVRLPERG